MMKPFEPFALPTSGTNLIEASAGTGKTFGIAALFVRWVLLEKKSVTRLLVLTFTKAATAELKTRLRARLSQILHLSQTRDNQSSITEIANDAFLGELFTRLDAGDEFPEHIALRLRAALDEFDSAGIYTIHGFCRSVLNDEAFLCGAPFAVEQVEHQGDLIEWSRDDFWRRTVASDPACAQLCFEENLSPSAALDSIRPHLNKPYLHYEIPAPRLSQAQQDFAECLAALTPSLTTFLPAPEADAVMEQLCSEIKTKTFADFAPLWRAYIAQYGMNEAEAALWRVFPRLNGTIYKPETFYKLFLELRTLAEHGTLPGDLLLKLALLDEDALHSGGLKSKAQLSAAETAALAPLAALGQAYAQERMARDKALSAVRFKLLQHINHALNAEKRHSRARSFDDLLLDVHHALTASPYRAQLVQRLAASWDVLMVDEFQDTDPIQYAIFKKGFAEPGVPVYLVGDPKQAIYGFRGGDIYTYLQAAQDAGAQCYTLDTNYRAHENLVNAVAALFVRNHPFIHEHIDYPPIRAADAHSRLTPALQALTVFCLNEGQEKLTADEARARAADACADHMAQVLNRAAAGGLSYTPHHDPIKQRTLCAGDIAVLVRSHKEARQMMHTLKRRGIESVAIQRESVFATDEAAALAALLHFWLDPQQTGLLRFVLAGVLFHYTAAEIKTLNSDDAAVTRHTETARRAFALWQEAGLFAAYQYFNRETGLEAGLIRRGAERSLTNLFQLLELLAAAAGKCFGERALALWLDREIQAASGERGENTLLRLENDEALVKIITIHKSKGLQYPLVYCPFVSNDRKTSGNPVEKIHEASVTVLRDKSQLSQEDNEFIQQERLSEELRLLYVALTRASEAVVLCTSDTSKLKAEKLALDYLLQAYADPKATRWQAWQAWAASAALPAAIELSTALPDYTEFRGNRGDDIHFQAKTPPARSFGARRLTSFSAWTRAIDETEKNIEEELFSVDAGEQSVMAPATDRPDSIHTFAGGIHAGLCWHDILENFDFARPAAEQRELIVRKLSAYGFDGEYWGDILLPSFDDIRLAALSPHTTLATIPRRQRLPESGFLLDKIHFDPQAVLHYFSDDLPAIVSDALQHVSAHTVSGFFNGFIDMTAQDRAGEIYLIDYKSNRLGDDAAAYTAAALDTAMAQHQYAAQAVIYALATRRYLATRKVFPTSLHIRYLFLRGMQAQSAQGVWAWEMDCAKLAALDQGISD